MKKFLSLIIISTSILSIPCHAEVTTVGPGPRQVKPEDKSKSNKRWYGIAIAAGVVAIGIATCVIVSHQHNKHEHKK